MLWAQINQQVGQSFNKANVLYIFNKVCIISNIKIGKVQLVYWKISCFLFSKTHKISCYNHVM